MIPLILVKSWSLMSSLWRLAVVVLTPLILLPLLLTENASDESRCAYCMILVAVYWLTEAAPLAITALLPAALYPLLGVLSSKEACLIYMNETNMMFFTGITLAIAVEYCKLHERIALYMILLVGQSTRRLLVGFMLTTMLLSMWISNTATTAMMIPIVDAVMLELYKKPQKDVEDVKSNKMSPSNDPLNDDNQAPLQIDCQLTNTDDFSEYNKQRNIALLSVAYAANIGGTGTVTGTNPNLILFGYLSSTYAQDTGLNYATWMFFGVPTMLLATLAVAGAMLLSTITFKDLFAKVMRRNDPTSEQTRAAVTAREDAARRMLEERYRSLGSFTFHEKAVAIIFTTVVILWFTRAPKFMPGWGELFDIEQKVMTGGATPALLGMFLLFVIPKNPSTLKRGQHNGASTLLTWDVVKSRFPWEVLFIIGGGFSLAKGAGTSGLSKWISGQLRYLADLPSQVAVFLLCFLTATMTEVMSNSAVTALMLPVLKELAEVLQVNPLYLMVPATLSSSFAFMLPVATPPNTLVFSAADIQTSYMMRIGVVLNVICLVVLTFSINTWGLVLFDLHTFPQWANSTEHVQHLGL